MHTQPPGLTTCPVLHLVGPAHTQGHGATGPHLVVVVVVGCDVTARMTTTMMRDSRAAAAGRRREMWPPPPDLPAGVMVHHLVRSRAGSRGRGVGCHHHLRNHRCIDRHLDRRRVKMTTAIRGRRRAIFLHDRPVAADHRMIAVATVVVVPRGAVARRRPVEVGLADGRGHSPAGPLPDHRSRGIAAAACYHS